MKSTGKKINIVLCGNDYRLNISSVVGSGSTLVKLLYDKNVVDIADVLRKLEEFKTILDYDSFETSYNDMIHIARSLVEAGSNHKNIMLGVASSDKKGYGFPATSMAAICVAQAWKMLGRNVDLYIPKKEKDLVNLESIGVPVLGDVPSEAVRTLTRLEDNKVYPYGRKIPYQSVLTRRELIKVSNKPRGKHVEITYQGQIIRHIAILEGKNHS